MMKMITATAIALLLLLFSCGSDENTGSFMSGSLPDNPYDSYEKVATHMDSLQAQRKAFLPKKL